MSNKKPIFYRFRKFLFGQEYTPKQRHILGIATVMFGTGSGIAGPVIIENIMGRSFDDKFEHFSEALPFLLYFLLYIIIFFPIFYYISKAIVNIALYLFYFFKPRKGL